MSADREAQVALTLTADELYELTGYVRPADQLRRLREMGYWLARRTPVGVSVPRDHHLAVCAGARPQEHAAAQAARPQVRTAAMRRAARNHAPVQRRP